MRKDTPPIPMAGSPPPARTLAPPRISPLISSSPSPAGGSFRGLSRARAGAPPTGEPDPLPEAEVLAADNERLRCQLGRSEQLAGLGRLVAGIAHELNNPLSAVAGMLELMKQELVHDSPAPARETPSDERLASLRTLVAECSGAVDRMKDLVAAVRGMGRNGRGDAVAFDPGRAVRDAVKLFAVAHRRACQVALSLPALPAVLGSPTQLGQVVLNLLQNGLDASSADQPDLARLEVAAERVGDEVQIRVTDHGEGIPEDIAPYIFEPFFTSKPADKGTGIGLYLSREIVAEMRGTISFVSAPGNTVFRVSLPVFHPDDSDVPH
jgi:signal transduction histidine kinase